MGSSAILSCVVTRIAEIERITWRTNEGPIDNENDVTRSRNANSLSSTLKINSASQDETYICRVKLQKVPDAAFRAVHVFVYSE